MGQACVHRRCRYTERDVPLKDVDSSLMVMQLYRGTPDIQVTQFPIDINCEKLKEVLVWAYLAHIFVARKED